MLYQNDGFGKDYLIGLKDGLGADHARMVVKEESYETSEPTVNSQVVSLQGSGADVFLIAATPKFAAQAIRKTFDLGWTPVRYMTNVSQSGRHRHEAGGPREVKGSDNRRIRQGHDGPSVEERSRHKEFADFVAKYMTPNDLIDANAVYGFNAALGMVQVLKQCGNDLSRDNIMKQAANLRISRRRCCCPA